MKKTEVPLTVFISYASEDRSIAIDLAEALRKAGHSPWIDVEQLLPGVDWKLEISRAIETCQVFIAIMSSRSVSKKGFVQKELKLALEVVEQLPQGETFIIPVRSEACTPSYPFLRNVQWIDLFPIMENGIAKILKSLKLLETKSSAIPPIHTNKNTHDYETNATHRPLTNMYPSLETVFSKLASMIPGSMILGSIKDNLTIAEHAAFFAEEVGFKKSLIPALRLGVIARDIGMLFIPVQILTKTAALSHEEYSQIQRHMIYGESIVRAVKDPNAIIAANIIRSHHERWSGSGQPDGLREEEIPLVARIVSIIGAFHSIRAKRAYRPGCSPEEALQYMKETKGEFDPALFSQFCEERIFLWKPSAH